MGSKPAMPTFTLPPPVKPLVPPPAEAGPSQSAPPSSTTDTLAEELDSKSLNDTSRPTSAGDSVGPLSPAEISTLLSSALIQSLSSLPPSAFPLPASSLYSAHILPNRPAYIPREQRDDVVIGKSEWKKLAKWMKEVSKEGIVKTKEIKGEVTVMGYVSAFESRKMAIVRADGDSGTIQHTLPSMVMFPSSPSPRKRPKLRRRQREKQLRPSCKRQGW